MNQGVVWFNFLAFTLMFAAFAFAFIDYLQDRRPWLRTYLLSFAAFACWLLLATYRFFMAEFVPGSHATLDLAIGWTRVALSLVMGFAAPLLVVQLKHGRAAPRHLLLCAITPLVVAAAMPVYTATGLVVLAVTLNIAFNVFQAAMAAWGFRVLRGAVSDPRAASLRAYFLLSVGLYLVAIAYAALGQLVTSAAIPASNALLNGVFGLAWSVLMIAHQVKRTKARAAEARGLPGFFVREFRITGREDAVIRLLAEGLTTKDIGERLFVSPRTVETHCLNVYRKCGVSNRVELLRLVENCRTR
jgi:DNA-binding CsgD family transcriptional regulator